MVVDWYWYSFICSSFFWAAPRAMHRPPPSFTHNTRAHLLIYYVAVINDGGFPFFYCKCKYRSMVTETVTYPRTMNVLLFDEGFTDDDAFSFDASTAMTIIPEVDHNDQCRSIRECEGTSTVFDTFNALVIDAALELVFKLLASLPRSRLASIQRRIAPLLQFDVVGVSLSLSLPTRPLTHSLTRARIVSPSRSLAPNIQPPLIPISPPMRTRQPSLARTRERPLPLEKSVQGSWVGMETAVEDTWVPGFVGSVEGCGG